MAFSREYKYEHVVMLKRQCIVYEAIQAVLVNIAYTFSSLCTLWQGMQQ